MFLEIILFSYFMITGLQKYMKTSYGKCTSDVKLAGKVALITGANSGLGKLAAIDLADRGAKVILACRNVDAANDIKDEIIERTDNPNIIVHFVDFESLESIHDLSKKLHATEDRIDILINNAGAIGGFRSTFTKDDLPTGMQVNYYASFLLTILLLDLLRKSTPSRIINITSGLYKFSTLKSTLDTLTNASQRSDLQMYCDSKFCTILFSKELAQRLANTGITLNCVNPGFVDTKFYQNLSYFKWLCVKILSFMIFKTPREGVQTIIYAAAAEELTQVTGKILVDCKLQEMPKCIQDDKLVSKIWSLTESALKLEGK